MARRDVQLRLQARADQVLAKAGPDATRHKCFVSYHADDADEVGEFLDAFGSVFIPRVVGLSEEDDFIDSDNTDYVMDKIREKYLTDSTVTIVLVGKCAWARKFVDWEVSSSLRNDAKNKCSGLMAITLRSVANDSGRKLPARVDDNVDGDKLYARWWKYPTTQGQLRGYIQTAFDARSTITPDNSRPRRTYNSQCP